MPAPLVLYRFRYRDPLTGRWTRARYRATVVEISARHAEWVLEDAEQRVVEAATVGALATAPPGSPRGWEPPSGGDVTLEATSTIDGSEAALVACFLRRYVTYCARRGRYAAMNGAARLLRRIAPRAPVAVPAGAS
jgi:hypothetical protein